jgi:uracil-DNA glycosylase
MAKRSKVITALVAQQQLREQFRSHAEEMGLAVDVMGEGSINASTLVIGEGPGENEVRKGRPFIAGSGNLLFDALRPYGIDRDDCYVTNDKSVSPENQMNDMSSSGTNSTNGSGSRSGRWRNYPTFTTY